MSASETSSPVIQLDADYEDTSDTVAPESRTSVTGIQLRTDYEDTSAAAAVRDEASAPYTSQPHTYDDLRQGHHTVGQTDGAGYDPILHQ